jgi:hypothetical protein
MYHILAVAAGLYAALLFGDAATAADVLLPPPVVEGSPAAGRRVRVTLPEHAGTAVHHTLLLPADWSAARWEAGHRWPVIVEYAGNFHPPSGSAGTVEGAVLGYGLTRGQADLRSSARRRRVRRCAVVPIASARAANRQEIAAFPQMPQRGPGVNLLLPARVGQPVARFGGGRKWARRKAIVAASLSGIFPIVVTPFHEDGSVDFESQDRLVEHLLEQGAHGLGLFGNASEGYTLAAEERATIMKRVARRVAGRVLACCLAIALARYWWPT